MGKNQISERSKRRASARLQVKHEARISEHQEPYINWYRDPEYRKSIKLPDDFPEAMIIQMGRNQAELKHGYHPNKTTLKRYGLRTIWDNHRVLDEK